MKKSTSDISASDLMLGSALVAFCMAVAVAALAGPVLTIYGIYAAATGGGYGMLATGVATWLFMGPKPWKSGKSGAALQTAVADAPEAASVPMKNLAPDFNLEAAVTLGKKMSIRPAIKLKGRPHDLGQP